MLAQLVDGHNVCKMRSVKCWLPLFNDCRYVRSPIFQP
ncbi:hypothetical protein CPter291_3805 [Collimonas pratensis]|uniref:Uncharacterized protein n=1 Tax=Collimonas pratensis TaxID=279113 RepID=A0ABN4MHD2_9BURK|nr:hypothetical protein CPter291_3805 [Collimonas pratensis]